MHEFGTSALALGRKGGHVDGDADREAVAVLEARLALRGNLLADDVDVRVARFLRQGRQCAVGEQDAVLSMQCARTSPASGCWV